MKRIIAMLPMIILMCTSICFASSNGTTSKSFIVNANLDSSTVQEANIKGADNSMLPVRVISYSDNVETTIFTGNLGDYDNGAWSNTDFTTIEFLAIYDWTTEAIIYIIPVLNEVGIDLQNNAINEPVEYNVTYSIDATENGTSIVADYSVYNGCDKAKNITLIASLYTGNTLNSISTKSLNIQSFETMADTIAMPVVDSQNQCVKLMVWETPNIRPIGTVKAIIDLESYQREKHIYYTALADKEIKLFMNADNSKGSNDGVMHTILYDTSKFQPIDLCLFTFEKELSKGIISDAGVIIQSVDLTAGVIQYQFENCFSQRYTGINNIVKFKTLVDLTDEEITYIIQ